jgi:ubiquinone/menaquinone biosynthesis C-methylase UbiE
MSFALHARNVTERTVLMDQNLADGASSENRKDIASMRYDRNARFFDFMDSLFGKMMERRKHELIAGASGRVLEVGIGTGKSLAYYPKGVELVGIDISPKMLARAELRAAAFPGAVDLRVGDVQALDFAADSFDMVITSCVFCSVTDPIRGFQEVRRVLRPGGTGMHLEHVRSKHPLIGKLMDILNPLVVRMAGANINRDTAENIRRSGLGLLEEQDLWFDILKLFKVTKEQNSPRSE